MSLAVIVVLLRSGGLCKPNPKPVPRWPPPWISSPTLGAARPLAIAAADCLPTATRGSQSSYTTSRTFGANYLITGRFSPAYGFSGTESATPASPAATATGRKFIPKIVLTDARIRALRPRRTAYDIRDGKLGGFGTRVLPSGRRRFFVHSQHRGERVWKILGDAATMSVDEARSSAVRTLAAIRRGEDLPRDPDETIFEAVAETMFDRYARLWEPGTLHVNRCYLKNQILPRFQGRQVANIDRRDVRDWFASLRATPVAADRSMVHARALRHP